MNPSSSRTPTTSLTAPPPPPIQPPSPSPAPTMLRWSPPSPPTKPRTIPATPSISSAPPLDADNSDQLSVSNQSASAVDGNGSTISIPSGALSLSGQNLTVDPNEFNYLAVGESVVITYSYDVADGTTTTANTATITITGNDAPVVSAITSNKTEDDSSYSIDLLGTASDTDNSDSLSVSNQSASAVDGNGSTISIPSGALSLSGQNLTVDPNEFNYLAVIESVVITYSYDVAQTAPPPPPIQPPSPSPAPTMLRWSPPSPPTKPRTIPATPSISSAPPPTPITPINSPFPLRLRC